MRPGRLLAIGFAALFTLAIAAFAMSNTVLSDKLPLPLVKPRADQPPKPLTLWEAWDVARQRAVSWDSQGAVASLRSVDHPADPQLTMVPGNDGYRRAWQAILMSPQQSESLWITIWDGVIVDETRQPADSQMASMSDKFRLDSPQALELALSARKGFVPANGKDHGYQFGLGISLAGNTVIKVFGIHDQVPAVIEIDPVSKTVVSAKEWSVEGAGGVLYSKDQGRMWNASSLRNTMTTGAYADPTIKNRGFATTIEDRQITVYETRDGGASWRLWAVLPKEAGEWGLSICALTVANDQTSVLVGARSGLWASTDGNSWRVMEGLPKGDKQWLATVQNAQAYRLFVSVTSGGQDGVYSTRDTKTWKKETAGIYRLSESYNKDSVLAVDSTQQSGKAYRFGIETVNELALPIGVMNAAGDFNDVSQTVVRSRSYSAPLSGSSAQRRDYGIVSLAASPNFPANQLLIGGGFRTGIYRSEDGGRSWNKVVTNPSDFVSGSNEIFAVRFLSADSVIAVNGGVISWKDF